MTKVGFRKLPPKVFEYRSFKSYEKKALITDLGQVPWKEIDGVGDIDDTVFLWEMLFKVPLRRNFTFLFSPFFYPE